MDAERQRIEEDLRGTIAGEVRCDDLFVQLYASDASIYERRPLGVVRPRHAKDVAATLQYASENHLPVHARGAGTGLAGESLGAGLVVDFSRYMRRVLSVDDSQVRVQAGVVHASLNRELAKHGRLFGPDPAMSQVTTMGSVIAIDAAGSHWPRYGSARAHVVSLKVALADGEILELSRHPLRPTAGRAEPGRARHLVERISGLVERHAGAIAKYRPQSLVNRSGYRLDDVLEDGWIDLARLLVGSEGTLGLITEATVTTDPLPGHAGCVLLLFDSLEKAARAALELQELEPAACDLMDRRHLTLARESDPRYELLIPQEAEAVLLVEQHAETRAQLEERLDGIVELAQYRTRLAAGTHVTHDAADLEMFWQLAGRFVPTLYRLKGSTRPIPCVEDIAVPPAALPVFLRHLQDTLKRHEITASLFGHAGHGQLHIRPFLDLANPHDIGRMESLASELYEKVWLLGGTISGEHGDGMSRTPFLARQYGPLVNVFGELKRIFDPQGILNPGKVVPVAHSRMTQHLRRVACPPPAPLDDTAGPDENAAPAPAAMSELQLSWNPDEAAQVARTCNGCGACRSLAPEVRMCPIFRYAPREEASPRAKANILRAILTGQMDRDELLQDRCKSVADLCVHCHMCRLECPAEADIPKMMLEAKATYVCTNGLRVDDWLLARIDAFSAAAGKFPAVANWAIANPNIRWILEKLFGLAQGRKLPRLARRSFLRWAALKRLHRPSPTSGEKVVYFVDTYANHFDTQLAEALVAVLRHNGVAVRVPTDQRHAGMAMISQGVLDPARQLAERNVALLAEAVRQGYTIVATEPSAALALTREYPIILDDDEDALLVAANTQEACHYLWQLHQRGRLRLDFRPQRISAGYHVPCHQRALGAGNPTLNLLRLVPGMRIKQLELGCSGMAGTFGMKRRNYRASLRAGRDLMAMMRSRSFQIGTTECSTCKIQMEQSTKKPTVHPLKLLALAYGLMPELGDCVAARGEPLVVT